MCARAGLREPNVALSVAAIRVLGKAERQARHAARQRCATVWFGRVAFAFLLFGAWQLAAGTIIDATYIGRPTSIITAWWGLATSGTLWQNAQYTLFEFIVGFAAGALAGIC